MSYKPGDKLVLEIGNVVNVPGYERVYIGKYSAGSFTESSLHDLDRLDSDYINEHYGDLQDEAYQQGMDDAWALAKKIVLFEKQGGIPVKNLSEIFGTESIQEILRINNPQEIISKIEAWEKAKQEIKVGDVVMDTEDNVFVVIRQASGDVCSLINSKGEHQAALEKHLTKTGRTIDIQSVLEKIGGSK